jgi:hypothetical protein
MAVFMASSITESYLRGAQNERQRGGTTRVHQLQIGHPQSAAGAEAESSYFQGRRWRRVPLRASTFPTQNALVMKGSGVRVPPSALGSRRALAPPCIRYRAPHPLRAPRTAVWSAPSPGAALARSATGGAAGRAGHRAASRGERLKIQPLASDPIRMTWRPPPKLPSSLLIVSLVMPIVLGDLFTWAVFALGCGLIENSNPPYCAGTSPELWLHLPLVAALVAFVAAALTRGLRSLWVLGAGLAVGFLGGVFPWVLYGDPAGNFGGLL